MNPNGVHYESRLRGIRGKRKEERRWTRVLGLVKTRKTTKTWAWLGGKHVPATLQSARHVYSGRIYADTRFLKHPVGNNFPFSDILAGRQWYGDGSTVGSAVHAGGYGWWRYPGMGVWQGGRVLVGHRGMGPGGGPAVVPAVVLQWYRL